MIAAKLATMKVGDNQHAPIGATSQSDAAAKLNVSRRALQRAKKIQGEAPDLAEKVEAGEMTVGAAENLTRADLTALERARHLKRRKEIFDAKGVQKKDTPGGEQAIGFDRDTADKTGLGKSTIHASRTRAEKIAPDVKEAIKDMPRIRAGRSCSGTPSGLLTGPHAPLMILKYRWRPSWKQTRF